MPKQRPDGVYFASYTKTHYYILKGRKSCDYPTKLEAAKEYIKAFVKAFPSKHDAVAGKSWNDIFRMFDIAL